MFFDDLWNLFVLAIFSFAEFSFLRSCSLGIGTARKELCSFCVLLQTMAKEEVSVDHAVPTYIHIPSMVPVLVV